MTSSMDAEQGLVGRGRHQRADEERHQRPARFGLRVLHQPAPEGLADAIRRCRLEHRRQAGNELSPVRRHGRRPVEAEQGVLLRQLRVHAGPPGRRQHRVGADAGDAAGRFVAVADADLRSAVGESGRLGAYAVPGRCPGDPNYALCNTATNPGCLNIIPAARLDPIAQKIASYFPANNIDRERDNYFVSAPFEFDRQQVDTKVDYNVNSEVQSRRHLRRPPLPNVGADRVRGRGRGRAHRRQQQSRARPRQHLPVHRHGHLHLHADVPDGRALRVGPTRDRVGAAGPRHEHRQ